MSQDTAFSCGSVEDAVSHSHVVNQCTLPFTSLALVRCFFYVLSLHKSSIDHKCSKNSEICLQFSLIVFYFNK